MTPHPSAGNILRRPFPLPRPRSQRTRAVARWFGLPADPRSTPRTEGDPSVTRLLPSTGQIVLITGPSGSGKSSLLRELMTRLGPGEAIDLAALKLPSLAVVDCIRSIRLGPALRLLSQVGLAEAWTYLRTPAELSDGQRWRLRMAIGLDRLSRRPAGVLVCDEFGALLDRVTAAVIARSLRRVIAARNARAIVATSHDDLALALRPDLHVQCDFECVRTIRASTRIRTAG